MAGRYTNYDLLLKDLQSNDLQAFTFLYQDARVWMYATAYTIIPDESAAQDLVQDFFIDFWQNRTYKQIDHSLKGYLLKSIRHRAYNYLDKLATQQKLKRLYTGKENIVLPVRSGEQEETKKALDAALKRVPPASAAVFTLHYMDQLSHAQIAEKLGLSHHTVRNHMAKALRILREELKNFRNE